ncbi:MAG TPA: phosphoglycerate dehydrogenase [Candidatus Methylomirabilis sp.]|nr:phosphoglycerate dehydrogenase [Candidatus Methylomirabilis sp.]
MPSQFDLPVSRVRVLVTDNLSPRGVELLRQTPGVEVEVRNKLAPEDLKTILRDMDALIVRSATKVTPDVLTAAPRLKVVGRAGVGVDNVDLEAATARGVVVMNTPGGNTVSAAEHTMSMLLSLAKQIPQATASMKGGKWEKGKFLSVELSNKVLGIIGLGRIGSEVARRAKPFNLRVLAFDPFITAEAAQALGVELVELPDLYRQSDFITLHTPLTEETKDLINAATIARMKDGVRIVNCARGGIVNETALCEALKSGKVAGAALDVFSQEPITDSPLFGLPNFISTPHLAAASEEAQEAVAVEIAQQVVDYLQKGIIRNAVNAPSVPLEVLRTLQPYLTLGEKLGRLTSQLSEGRLAEIHLEYRGEIASLDCIPLTVATVKGILDPIHDTVNMVNAMAIARGRGVRVVETKSTEPTDFASLITINLQTDRGKLQTAGTLYSRQDPRVVDIDGFRLEALLEGYMLVFSNLDVPGVIGRIGTMLGQNHVNIAGMQLGRERRGGRAVSIVNVDDPIPVAVLEEIRRIPNIVYAKLVRV